ncbi:MAG: flagellar hook capping FlgD N-terminal domain-containing protein [Oscillospiraceae bacterium]
MTDPISGGNTLPKWETEKQAAGTGNIIDAVYADPNEKDVKVQDFLDLMIQQLKNQDFMNPVDDTQYITQMAQFATMQQMQELAYNSKSTYVMSLVGKDVTVAKMAMGGDMKQKTGPVEKISFVNGDFKIVIDGDEYSIGQIMEVHGDLAADNKHLADPSKLNLFTTDLRSDYAKLTWETPTKDKEIADGLTYTVYYSENEAFDTVEDVKKGDICGSSEQKSLNEAELFNLKEGTTYYANVVVKDKNGVEAVYKKTTFTTAD